MFKSIKPLLFIFIITFGITILLVGCQTPTESVEEVEEIERSYTKTIERTYANEFERALIDSAEAAYPTRDSVIADLYAMYAGLREWDEVIPEVNYWYWFSNDGVLIPYSLTIEAISYYSNLIDSLETGQAHQSIQKAEFEFDASITFFENYEFKWPDDWPPPRDNDLPTYLFEMVFVVQSSMKWHHQCIHECLMIINHKRTVVFDKQGNIIQIFLDGPWPVSTS